MRSKTLSIAAALALLVCGTNEATEVVVTSSFTGIWNQPDHESQGFVIQIVEQPGGAREGIAYWFTYDNGEPVWILGQGPVVGNRMDMDFYLVRGPDFLSPTDPSLRLQESFGAATLTFDSCNNGMLEGEAAKAVTGTGLGRVAITRLSSVLGTTCSGGVSDDIPASQSGTQEALIFTSTGLIPGASGDAEFEVSAGRTRFDVEIEDVPEGSYDLLVGGVLQGQVDVTMSGDGDLEGEIEFRSPMDAGHPLLTFDPRDQLIEVATDGGVILSGTLGQTGPPGDPGLIGGNLEIEIDLNNLGVFPAGDAKAEFEQRPDRAEFDVELEDVPVGDYTLRVDGVDRGTISVVDVADGTEGELEFRTPVEPGKLPLDFDPRGVPIEILDGMTLIFSSEFPAGGGIGDPPTTSEVTVSFEDTGVQPGANGTASLEVNGAETEFEVEIEDLSDGDYNLIVAFVQRGTITVQDGEGRIKFRDPQRDDDPLLDFDPRGELIQVSRDGTPVLEVDFPN